MNILGLSCYYHDSAAALIKNGILVAAIQEERLNRIKHCADFPELAINSCLKIGKLEKKDLDFVVFYEKPIVKFDRILTSHLATWPKSFKAYKASLPLWLKERLHIKKRLQDFFHPDTQILFSEHHLSHSASAFLPSPFQRAAIMTVDGVGEWTTTSLGFAENTSIIIDEEIKFPHSIGLFYSALTAYLGFKVNSGEWKVMGLAPFGQPRYLEHFQKMLKLYADGSFKLEMDFFSHHHSLDTPYSPAYPMLLGQKSRIPESELTDFHRDIAASGQKMVELALINMAQALYKKYHCKNLCIGGGVGLNSTANWKILKETPFENIFIQPAAGDDGAAIGAALYLYNSILDNKRKYTMDHVYLGPEYGDDEIEKALSEKGLVFVKYSEQFRLITKTAQIIARGSVVGFFQGRMEFGPRALGNRSILADPTRTDIKDLINSKVKYRESFRPFAPSILAEEAPNYFEMDHESPFMLLIPQVRPEKRALLPGITHIDGSARVQTVKRENNIIFYDLIKEFGKIKGLPVLLNTSFNIRGEPIVESPGDAINCFLKTGLDYLIIGNYIVSKAENPAIGEIYAKE